MTATKDEQALLEFMLENEEHIQQALVIHAEYLRREADNAEAQACAILDDPERASERNQAIALRRAAEPLRDGAATVDNLAGDLTRLMDKLDPGDPADD